MPQVGWLCSLNKKLVSFDDCIDCARQINPRGRCDFTPEILIGIRNSIYPKSPEQILKSKSLGLTTLIGETRQRILELFCTYYAEPSWSMYRGTLAHSLIENVTRSDAWHEVAYKRTLTIDGETWYVSGRADVIIPYKPITIIDYKTTVAVPRYEKTYGNHKEQLNAYRWLFEPLFIAEKLRVEYMDMKRIRRMDVEIENIAEVGERLKESAELYVKHLKAKTAPPGEYAKKYPCSYCSVIEECKKYKTNQKLNGGSNAKRS
jgi:hypothetical protein